MSTNRASPSINGSCALIIFLSSTRLYPEDVLLAYSKKKKALDAHRKINCLTEVVMHEADLGEPRPLAGMPVSVLIAGFALHRIFQSILARTSSEICCHFPAPARCRCLSVRQNERADHTPFLRIIIRCLGHVHAPSFFRALSWRIY
jgi:hypothetical protein